MNLDLRLYPPDLFLAEREAAHFLARLLAKKVKKIHPIQDGLKHKQPDAVWNACNHPVSILTGPPGTGKTTTVRQIVASCREANLRVLIVAPTGKAAKRAFEVVNAGKSFVQFVNCQTIHAALEFIPQEGGFNYNRFSYLPYDVVVMDEFSMTDMELFRDFIEAIHPGKTRVVLCGDPYQLPSVGPGNIARDLIQSHKIPVVELDVVLRTGENSGITFNANRILRGQDISKQDSQGTLFKDFFFVEKASEQDTIKAILKWIIEDLPAKRGFDSIRDIQVMTPGKNGLVGRKNLNKILRDALNPPAKGAVTSGWRVRDKVMNIKNDKRLNIVNGDVGFIKEIIHGQNGFHLVVDFGAGVGPDQTGIVEFKRDILDRLYLAFAQTVHKSQGSEFPVEILPLHACHTRLLTRNLIYTGLTRGKQLGILVGSGRILTSGIRNTISHRRQTGFVEAIQQAVQQIAV